jgi:hypothetical protein
MNGFVDGMSESVSYWTKAFAMSMLSAGVTLSCMPDALEVSNLKVADTKIVVSSLILPDSSVAVLLTKSIGALEANDDSNPQALISEIAINDASVTITANDSIYELLFLQDGIYHASNIPIVAGMECHLNVSSKSLGDVSATATVQNPVYFDSVAVQAILNHNQGLWAEVAYKIQDPNSPNYYLINVQKAKNKSLARDILKPDAYTHPLDDSEFNAQEFSEKFLATNKYLSAGDTIEVSLSNVSEDYFNYVNLRLENHLELVEVFSEPVYYPTNVVGGRGFFNLYLTDIRLIVL